MDDINCVRLVTGEDLIGNITWKHSEVTVKNPAMIVVMQAGEGRFNIGLAPYLPYAKEKEFHFREDSVLTRFEPNIELRNEYSRIFGSGIVVANTVPSKLKLEI